MRTGYNQHKQSRRAYSPSKNQSFGGHAQLRNDRAYSDYYGSYGEQGFSSGRNESYPNYDDSYSVPYSQNPQGFGYGPVFYDEESRRLGLEHWTAPSHSSFQQNKQPQQGRFLGVGPRGYKRSDDRIYEEVCEVLAQDPGIDASDIDVGVKDGTVTLAGSVDSRFAKRQVEDCIEGVSGVNDVINNIRVEASSRYTSDKSEKSERINGTQQNQPSSMSSRKN